MPKQGDRVEMLNGSMKGTITEVMKGRSKYFMVVKWDDGETGNVHPLDVKLLSSPRSEDRMPRVNPRASATTRDRQLRAQQRWLKEHPQFRDARQAIAAGY